MAQNLISMAWTAEELAQFDAALDSAEAVSLRLISLETGETRGMYKMGSKSESFCRGTLGVLEQNRRIVPDSLELEEALADLAALDALRPRLRRLKQLTKRAEDTELLLGADIFSAALEGYALLKVSGKNHGLEDLRKQLSARFGRTSRKTAEPVPE